MNHFLSNKKVIFQVTKIYMKKNWKRTLITFLGIMVMVILMTAVFVGKDTVLQFMIDAVSEDRGSWHAQVYDLNSDQVEAVRALPYIEQVAISRPLNYSDFPQSGNPDETPFLEIKGYSGDVFQWLNIKLVNGRFPQNEKEIVISERAIMDGSTIQLGDTIEVDAFRRYIHAFSRGEDDTGLIMFSSDFYVDHGDTKEVPAHFANFISNDEFEMIHVPTGFHETYTLVGIIETPYYENAGQGSYTALTLTSMELAPEERVNLVLKADLNKNYDLNADLNRIVNSTLTQEELDWLAETGFGLIDSMTGEKLPVQAGRVEVNDLLLMFSAKGSDGTFNSILIFFETFFIVLITAAALVLIYNVFNISYRERSRYLGMLSSVGATRSQKRWSVYYEIFVLLLMALPSGIVLGIFVVKGGMALLYPHFTQIIGLISENMIKGKSGDIGYHIVINWKNILFIVLFSMVAVWISAWGPAIRIGKTSPIISIRGNDDIKTKKHKTRLSLLKGNNPKIMLASASVSRNRSTTKGIVLSITAFISLTLITAFSAQTLTDIINSKTNNITVDTGKAFSEYQYVFSSEETELYEQYKAEIMSSDEVSGFKEAHMNLYNTCISPDQLSKEYTESLTKIIRAYFPDGIPDYADENLLHPTDLLSYPRVSSLVLSNEDFEALAKAAGISLTSQNDDAPLVLFYNTLSLSTDDYRFTFDGALIPDYAVYQLRDPLLVSPGEVFRISAYDGEKQEDVEIPFTLGGYVGKNELKNWYTVNDGDLWMILSEDTDAKIQEQVSIAGLGFSDHYVFFNTKEEDSPLLTRLSLVTDSFGNSCLRDITTYKGWTSFSGAIAKILSILAVCFTLLIAIICLLNLYNSVVGRKAARRTELSVLHSLGMTTGERQKMLLFENLRLLIRSFLYSAFITSIFVVLLHQVISDRFGRVLFQFPAWIILSAVLASVFALIVMSALVYRKQETTLIRM